MTISTPSAAVPPPFGSQPAPGQRDAPVGVAQPPAALTGASIPSIIAERQRQVDQYGHTPGADLAQPLGHLPRAAREILGAILDDIQFHKPRAQMRRRATKAAALLVAFIDRLDTEGA